MNELRIIRGTDVSLYINDAPLFGVIAFSAEEKPLFHEVYEYLCVKPCERIPQGTEYHILIGMMSLFDHQLPADEAFTLRVIDGNVAYCYKNCRVTDRRTKAEGNRMATQEFAIKADQMEKQVTGNE
ncbi:MAG: hypothetical protein IJG87_01475 [Ruminococcus sp.]|nr:hypothetical protein [Ruminococcus sp.]